MSLIIIDGLRYNYEAYPKSVTIRSGKFETAVPNYKIRQRGRVSAEDIIRFIRASGKGFLT